MATRIDERWSRDRIALPLALLAPVLVTVAVVPFRDDFANTNAALVLVIVIVAFAAIGSRVAGLVAALSAAVSFDLLLTEPYGRLTISDRSDLETAALLLAVGVGVTQIAVWGRRQHALADRDAGYLDGIRAAAEAVATGASASVLVTEVSEQLRRILGLSACHFEYGVAGLGQPARLRENGRVERNHEEWDVDRDGLPTDTDIELLVESAGRLQGRFLLRAGPGQHPSVAQRLVAVTLAAQVGAALR